MLDAASLNRRRPQPSANGAGKGTREEVRSQKACKRSSRRSGGLPAISAALIAPWKFPYRISGLRPAASTASKHPALIGPQRAAALSTRTQRSLSVCLLAIVPESLLHLAPRSRALQRRLGKRRSRPDRQHLPFIPLMQAYMPLTMARPTPLAFDKKTVAKNRRARFDYAIEEVFEAGIALTGTEAKSLRFGDGSIAESDAEVQRRARSGWSIRTCPEFGLREPCFDHERKRPLQAAAARARDRQAGTAAVELQGDDAGAALGLLQRARPRQGGDRRWPRARPPPTSAQTIKERDWQREQGAAACASTAERPRPPLRSTRSSRGGAARLSGTRRHGAGQRWTR